jgi:small-conductance mechanosensitive channel
MDALAGIVRQWNGLLEPYPLLRALQVIVVFLLLAALVDRLISGITRRIVSRTETHLDDQILKILHRPIFSSVALVGLIIALYEFDLSPGILLITTSLVQTILIVLWLGFGLRFSGIVLGAMRDSESRFTMVQQTTEPLLKNAAAVLVFIAGVYGILVAWDVDVTAVVASAGIIGLALSFAAQDTLANLFAGVAILADRPYQIGDYIILDSGERGQVTQIGLRSTRLLTRDDVEVSIPNGVMGAAKIVNEAAGVPNRYRIKISVGVAYGSDVDGVMEALLAVGESHPEVLRYPEARARFRTFGASSLDFELLCWIADPAERGRVSHELNIQVYKRFADLGITIPFPQQDLYIKELPAG